MPESDDMQRFDQLLEAMTTKPPIAEVAEDEADSEDGED